MASKIHKKLLTFNSIERLTKTMAKLAEVTGVPAASMPQHDRDPELLAAYRIEALAGWADSLLAHLEAAKPARPVSKQKLKTAISQTLDEKRQAANANQESDKLN